MGLKIRRHRRGRMLDFIEIAPYKEPMTYLAGSDNSPHLLLGDLAASPLAVLMTVLTFGAVLRCGLSLRHSGRPRLLGRRSDRCYLDIGKGCAYSPTRGVPRRSLRLRGRAVPQR